MAKRYALDKKDLGDLVKVAIYSGLSASLLVIISALTTIDVPAQYAFAIPLINVTLVALKDFLEDRASRL